MNLYDFPKSSASYRVRILCNLKNVGEEKTLVNFREAAQRSPEYLAIAPSGLVPTIEDDDGFTLSQSIAIARFLDRQFPEPRLIPEDPRDEARVLETSLVIACDIHPLNNLRVLKYLENEMSQDEAARNKWYAHWVRLGFETLERSIEVADTRYVGGNTLSLADVCLVPQMFNARRFDVELDDFPRITAIDARLRAIPEFERAAP